MKRTGIVAFSLVIGCFVAIRARAESLGEMFNRVKADFSQGHYKKSLADVEALDAATQLPAAAGERPKLVAAIAFYRAASLAALGRAGEAKDEFINFVVLSPNTSISSPPFPRSVVDAFEKAQKAAAGRSNTLATKFASFAGGPSLPADAQWAASPVRYLLSNEQKKQFAALTSAADREAFVADFWKAFDPTPDTPQNELRIEFERRVAFADAMFGTDKMPGRETDRALVLAFLGPPTFAGTSEVSGESDAIATLRSSIGPGGAIITGDPNSDKLEAPYKRGTREVWYYRKGRLPAGVPFQEVDFQFITKEGYGTAILQKESDVLQTMGQATDNARKIRKLN